MAKVVLCSRFPVDEAYLIRMVLGYIERTGRDWNFTAVSVKPGPVFRQSSA